MADLTDSQSSDNSTPLNHSRSTTSSFFTFPVSYAVNGLIRRISSDTEGQKSHRRRNTAENSSSDMSGNAYTSAPHRRPSPFQPPPLTPLTLEGYKSSTSNSARLLTRALAEEIRLLVPPRLQLVESWHLAFSLEQNGVSLATLFKNCEDYRGKRGGYVLVVRDGEGGVSVSSTTLYGLLHAHTLLKTFGAYLSDPPYPNAHYYGTGECFLWRAHSLPMVPTLTSLPPPPSADTTNAQRMTTLAYSKSGSDSGRSGTSTPERIRFKAFPYSGINDYMIFCEQGYLSVGGGCAFSLDSTIQYLGLTDMIVRDGHYGLWLDDNLEKGVSSRCLTFGNEPLSDEGTKFDVLGVEVWYIGS